MKKGKSRISKLNFPGEKLIEGADLGSWQDLQGKPEVLVPGDQKA